MTIRLPGSGSVFTGAGCVPGSESNIVWLGIAAPDNASASVTFWKSNTCANGASILATMKAAPCTISPLYGPYNLNASGLYVGNITAGSAVVWMR
jgi:hypothetical protein